MAVMDISKIKPIVKSNNLQRFGQNPTQQQGILDQINRINMEREEAAQMRLLRATTTQAERLLMQWRQREQQTMPPLELPPSVTSVQRGRSI